MKNISIFQVVLLGIFGFFILLAVLLFSGVIPGFTGGNKQEFLGNVSVWGTVPESSMTKIISDALLGDKSVAIAYTEFDMADFDRVLVEALASGTGPDVVLLPHDLIVRHSDKVYAIPYSTVSERVFRDTFAEEGELYLTPMGVLGLPLTIDPLVMYWNRDIFSSAGVTLPPKFWDEFPALTEKLVKRDTDGDFSQSAVALGEYSNVSHAKDILSMLVMQAGNPITRRVGAEGRIDSVLAERRSGTEAGPAVSAIRFYTEFSNSSRKAYTWNRALPLSRDMFTAGKLGMYFGYASEFPDIQRKNPNLNIDVSVVPQARSGGTRLTFGAMRGLSILKSSPNIPAAFRAVSLMSGSKISGATAVAFGLPPVRRDLLGERPSDAFFSVFYDSAIIARAWLDPMPVKSDAVFQSWVGDVLSGRRNAEDATVTAGAELGRLFQ